MTLTDVLVREVGLCAGPSNIEMPIDGYFGQPVVVRYGWTAWTGASRFDAAGRPAGSFRMDDWPMVP